MKHLQCAVALLLPNKYHKKQYENFKFALCVLLILHLLAFVTGVFAVQKFVTATYNEAVALLNSTENFYLSNSQFHYEGERLESTLKTLGLTVVIDGSSDASIDDPVISKTDKYFYAGPTSLNIRLGEISYTLAYSSFDDTVGPLDFSREFIIGEVLNADYIITNIINSSSVLIFIILTLVLLVVWLLMSIMIYMLYTISGISIGFSKRAFLSAGSLLYPTFLLGVICLVPSGLSWAIVNISLLLRSYLIIAIIYAIISIIPFKRATSATTQPQG